MVSLIVFFVIEDSSLVLGPLVIQVQIKAPGSDHGLSSHLKMPQNCQKNSTYEFVVVIVFIVVVIIVDIINP